MKITRLSQLLTFLLCSASLFAQSDIEGVCLTGPPRAINADVMVEIKSIGADWICLMPYAYGPSKEGKLEYNLAEWQWWGERKEGTRAMIKMAKDKGLKVMVKPHVWIERGTFTGSYNAGSEEAWMVFEESYAEYLLEFARLAESEKVEILCIGTEMELFVKERLNFWQRLIDRVSNVYSGKLTYAANWDEVERFPLWSRLDYVGVDGYFPLSTSAETNQEAMNTAWVKEMDALDTFCEKLERPLLFCEIGYRSCVDCTSKPWEHGMRKEIDMECQVKAYKAFFNAIEKSKTYAGCFLWKWHSSLDDHSKRESDFTPQWKPALAIIKQAFRAE